jgi:hypothetical protein
MGSSVGGILFAARGHQAPVTGAIVQELIDVVALANAMRVTRSPKNRSAYEGGPRA